MSTAKFEKLIDLIINEDQERAEQLFHEIVVEKSREIYESLMDEEELEEDMTTGLMQEIEAEEEEGESGMMEMEGEEEEIEAGDFDVEGGDDTENMGGDDMDVDMDMDDADMGSEEPATKDDIMDLEDKLDQLMAAFEEEFGSMSDEEGEEELEMGDEEGEEELEMGDEEGEEESGVMESVQLKKVGGETYNKFGHMGDDGAQKKSPVAANAGAKGPVGSVVKPVKFSGDTESAPTSPKAPASNAYNTKSEKNLKGAGTFQNAPGAVKGVKSGQGVAAPKPETKQASGVNTKDIVPESRKIVKKMVK